MTLDQTIKAFQIKNRKVIITWHEFLDSFRDLITEDQYVDYYHVLSIILACLNIGKFMDRPQANTVNTMFVLTGPVMLCILVYMLLYMVVEKVGSYLFDKISYYLPK